jgi:hypothetical protein
MAARQEPIEYSKGLLPSSFQDTIKSFQRYLLDTSDDYPRRPSEFQWRVREIVSHWWRLGRHEANDQLVH